VEWLIICTAIRLENVRATILLCSYRRLMTEVPPFQDHQARLAEALVLTTQAIALVDGISVTAQIRLGEAAAVLRMLTEVASDPAVRACVRT
jgi:hypothetical protein